MIIESDLCGLCGESGQVDSHILPKFIFRWMKKTGTGRLRAVSNINLPIEDGIVKKFLCNNCESRFNKSETYFANKVFYPVINDEIQEFKYDENLKYFIISIFWRVFKDSSYLDVNGTKWQENLIKFEEKCSAYLLNNEPLENFQEIHCIVGVDIIRNDNTDEDFIRYMSRVTDSGIPNSDELCFFYVKIPRFIFVIPIHGINLDLFENTKIEKSGTYRLNDAIINESIIGSHLYERSKLFREKKDEMSDKQKMAVRKLTDKQYENWINKDLGIIEEYLNERGSD
jgi:hypothetical protein